MKRTALLCMALAMGAAGSAEAQLTMQMSNGWSFTFAGNVNAFGVYEKQSDDGSTITPGGIVGVGGQGSSIRTGLLPAFAVLDAKGKEGNTDLGVHFGFAPQIQTGGGHDNFGDATGVQAGAQIDMRQVYLTVGGSWGQILAGREIGLYQRQNILTDQTLFGIGATGGNFGNPKGTTLGRIGFGYVYPNFNAQMTYSTPSGRAGQLSIGIFDPSTNEGYDEVKAPRVEAELTYNFGKSTVWLGGLAQNHTDLDLDESKTAWGGSGGLKLGFGGVTLVGSGYYGQGIGTTLMFLNGRSTASATTTENRTSYGYIGQLAFNPTGSKLTVAGSYGASILESADDELIDAKTTNSLISGGIYFQATKSLKVVGEGNYAWTSDNFDLTEKNSTFAGAFGLMLFF
jgi:hypothetical protein